MSISTMSDHGHRRHRARRPAPCWIVHGDDRRSRRADARARGAQCVPTRPDHDHCATCALIHLAQSLLTPDGADLAAAGLRSTVRRRPTAAAALTPPHPALLPRPRTSHRLTSFGPDAGAPPSVPSSVKPRTAHGDPVTGGPLRQGKLGDRMSIRNNRWVLVEQFGARARLLPRRRRALADTAAEPPPAPRQRPRTPPAPTPPSPLRHRRRRRPPPKRRRRRSGRSP